MKTLNRVCVLRSKPEPQRAWRRWWTAVLAGILTTPAWGADQPAATGPAEAPEAEAPVSLDEGFADYSNWLDLSVSGSRVGGNNAAFQQRHGVPADNAFGGVRELHYEKYLPKDWLLQIDGHGLFDYHDYAVTVDVTREDRGFLRGGYREYRTFYNGAGGYLPGADLWLPLADPELYVDRGNAWVEAGLTLPDWPVFRVKYNHQFRDGRKDSTIWGRVNSALGARGINASFYDLNEKRDTIAGEATHTIGKTGLGLKFTYEFSDNQNSLNVEEFPGTAASHRTQKEQVESDLFNVHAWSSTWFNNKTVLSAGYGYTRLDTDLSGSRVYGDTFDPVYDPAVLRGPGFINLSGNSLLNQHVVNLSFMASPCEHVTVVPAVRIEYQDVDGVSLYRPTRPGVTAGTNLGGVIIPDPTATGQVSVDSSRRQTTVGERLELRYTGFTNWLFYARGEWDQDDGDFRENSRPVDATALGAPTDATVQRTTEHQGLTQKYAVGANWYPLRRLSLAGQYYFKARDNDYDHSRDSTANDAASLNRYPAYLRANTFYTHDVNLRLTWRPLPTVTSVSRYDYQRSTVDTRADQLSTVESAEMRSHIISQSLTWSPITQLYLQGTLNYVLDETTTPVNGLATAPGLVQKAENDYWFATFGAGYALSKKTDLLADYSYYRADNYDAGNAATSLPYGAGAEEHTITAGVVHRLNANLRLSLRYGYFKFEDETSGDNNNFDAHLVSAGMQYRF